MIIIIIIISNINNHTITIIIIIIIIIMIIISITPAGAGRALRRAPGRSAAAPPYRSVSSYYKDYDFNMSQGLWI